MPWKWRPSPATVEQAFGEQRGADPFGHRLHALLAAVGAALICGPVSVIEFAWIPLLVCFLVRYPRHQVTHPALKRTIAPWLVLAWALWQGISTQWSIDREMALEEFGAMRFAIPILLMWPILDRRGWVVAGLGVGLLAANGAQVAHAIGTAFDLPSLTFPRLVGRNSGWWQPVVGGSMLIAGVGLHLPAALTARGKYRLIGALGLIVSVAGVAATGSRGAWLATGCLVVLGVAWFFRRLFGRGLTWGHLPLIVALVVVVAAAGYRTLWPGMRARAVEGVAEVRQIVESGDYRTYTGARIVMARWAWRAVREHPVRGIGAGSFKPWVAEQIQLHGPLAGSDTTNPAHAHCHNTLLHVTATTGVIGLAAFLGVIVLTLRGGWDAGDGQEASGYGAGPLFAVVGMVLVTPFDVINVNSQTAAMWWVLVGLCVWGRPKVVGSDEDASARVLPGE